MELTLGAWELAEWKQVYKEQPFGVERDNFHAALIAATLCNINRGKGSKPIEPSVFMVTDPEEHRQKSLSDALLTLRALAKTKKQLKKEAAAKRRARHDRLSKTRSTPRGAERQVLSGAGKSKRKAGSVR